MVAPSERQGQTAEILLPHRVRVFLPARGIPDLDAVARTQHDGLAVEAGILAEARRNDDAPLPVELTLESHGEKAPLDEAPLAGITAAAGQCETEPNDSPIGFADRDADSSVTPVHSTAAPRISQTRSDAFAIGTASTRAKTRYVVSSGSTNASDRLPIDHAARIMPVTMQPMPASQRGWCSRSVISRSDRNREAGSRWADCCCSTNPVPISSAARSVSP